MAAEEVEHADGFPEEAKELLNSLKEKFTSEVVKEVNDFADESMMIPHEAIRREMLKLLEVLHPDYMNADTIDSESEKWKLDAWFEIFQTRFYPVIHEHHDAEEKIMIPDMEKKCTVPERVGADHIQLMKMVDEIRDLRGNWVGLQDLRNKYYTMLVDMFEHLKMEEESITVLFRDNYTEEEYGALVQTILQAMPLSGHALFMPMILHAMESWNGGKEGATNWLNANVPFPIRFMNNNFWVPNHDKYNEAVLNSIKENDAKKYAANTSLSSGSCSIM